jgi:hypothetical protein
MLKAVQNNLNPLLLSGQGAQDDDSCFKTKGRASLALLLFLTSNDKKKYYFESLVTLAVPQT